jgi:hypothetical protein
MPEQAPDVNVTQPYMSRLPGRLVPVVMAVVVALDTVQLVVNPEADR